MKWVGYVGGVGAGLPYSGGGGPPCPARPLRAPVGGAGGRMVRPWLLAVLKWLRLIHDDAIIMVLVDGRRTTRRINGEGDGLGVSAGDSGMMVR